MGELISTPTPTCEPTRRHRTARLRRPAAAGDEPWECRPPRWLADGVVPQVEADPELVAHVGERAVQRHLVDEQHVAGLHRDRDGTVAWRNPLGNLETARAPGAMGEQPTSMRAGYDLQAARARCPPAGAGTRPSRSRVPSASGSTTPLSWCQLVAPILSEPVTGSRGCRTGLGNLDAHVLHGVREDLRSDEALDEVEGGRLEQHLEDRRPVPHRRVGL